VLDECLPARVPAAVVNLAVDLIAGAFEAGSVAGQAAWCGHPQRALYGDPRLQPRVGELLAPAAGLPDPLVGLIPGSNGCNGNIVATFNHGSGSGGASGNPKASAGRGFFFGGASPGSVSGAVHGVRSAFCS
jgi:hypothetical protein